MLEKRKIENEEREEQRKANEKKQDAEMRANKKQMNFSKMKAPTFKL